MGNNISEVSGNFINTTASPNLLVTGEDQDGWVATLDLGDPTVTSISGDFDEYDAGTGTSTGEASPYTFGPLSTTAYGTIVFDTNTGTFTFIVDRAAVIASGTDQIVSFTVTGNGPFGLGDEDSVTITILVCVASGTLIETSQGEVAVEELTVGDLVHTLDNGPQPVRWIGSRKIGAAELADNHSLRPIRILKGALGEGLPKKDLLVSPQHRVLVGGWRAELLFGEPEVLAPAKGLINDRTVIRDASVEEIEYFHILFDSHEIIKTDGAFTESFHPGAYTMREMDDTVRAELIQILPQLATPAGNYGNTARMALKVAEARLVDISREGF